MTLKLRDLEQFLDVTLLIRITILFYYLIGEQFSVISPKGVKKHG